MKVITRVCDVCGKPMIDQHARHTYELRKKFWGSGELGNRLDLCEECYKKFIAWLKAERK